MLSCVGPAIVSPELPNSHVHVVLDADSSATPRVFMSARSTSSVFRSRFVAGSSDRAPPVLAIPTSRPATQVGHVRARVSAQGYRHTLGRIRPSTQIAGQRPALSYSRNLSALGPRRYDDENFCTEGDSFEEVDEPQPLAAVAPISVDCTRPLPSVNDLGMNIMSYGISKANSDGSGVRSQQGYDS